MGKHTGNTTLKMERFGVPMVATGHPQKKNNDGNTALHLAARMGHVGSLGMGFFTPIDGGPGPIFKGGCLSFNTSLFVFLTKLFIHMFVCCLVSCWGYIYICL